MNLTNIAGLITGTGLGVAVNAIGMETFGASAPLKELPRKYGFTPEAIVAAGKAQMRRSH